MNQYGIIYPKQYSSYRGEEESFGRSYEPDFETIPEFRSAVEIQPAPAVMVTTKAVDVMPTQTAATEPQPQPVMSSGRVEDTSAPLRTNVATAPINGAPATQNNTGAEPDKTLLYAGIAGAVLLVVLVLVLVFKKKK